jgi:predicted Zn-ribbon and HTH transcriptional regulator
MPKPVNTDVLLANECSALEQTAHTVDLMANEIVVTIDATSKAEVVARVDEAMRLLRGIRRVFTAEPRTCEVCGVAFLGRADARYHDDTCRQRAHRRHS